MPQLSCPYQPEFACLISRTCRHNSTHYNIKGKKRKTFKDVDPIIFLFKTDLQAVPVSGFVPIHDATMDTLGEIVKKAHCKKTPKEKTPFNLSIYQRSFHKVATRGSQ
jgi:hypothetical protein